MHLADAPPSWATLKVVHENPSDGRNMICRNRNNVSSVWPDLTGCGVRCFACSAVSVCVCKWDCVRNFLFEWFRFGKMHSVHSTMVRHQPDFPSSSSLSLLLPSSSSWSSWSSVDLKFSNHSSWDIELIPRATTINYSLVSIFNWKKRKENNWKTENWV